LNGETYVVRVNEFSAMCNWQVVGVQVEQNRCKDRALRKAVTLKRVNKLCLKEDYQIRYDIKYYSLHPGSSIAACRRHPDWSARDSCDDLQ